MAKNFYSLLLMLSLMGPTFAAEIATGPEVGTKIPDFRARDQQGEWRSLEDLRGPQGLLLLFHRSADW